MPPARDEDTQWKGIEAAKARGSHSRDSATAPPSLHQQRIGAIYTRISPAPRGIACRGRNGLFDGWSEHRHGSSILHHARVQQAPPYASQSDHRRRARARRQCSRLERAVPSTAPTHAALAACSRRHNARLPGRPRPTTACVSKDVRVQLRWSHAKHGKRDTDATEGGDVTAGSSGWCLRSRHRQGGAVQNQPTEAPVKTATALLTAPPSAATDRKT